MKFITEQLYYIEYKTAGTYYELSDSYIASTIEEVISMFREDHPDSFIQKVMAGSKVKRKSTKTTKTITIDI